MANAKKDWLARSKMTHGDGNLSKQSPVKGKKADDPIKTFGTKSGGGKAGTSPSGNSFAKGLMQKGK
jgi:hypothetical protein